MLRKINELRTQKGSMMIEALAMLGLISMVTPVIYKKAAERTTEMQDINAASQVRVMVKAIDDYLRDNYATITAGGKVTSASATDEKEVTYTDFGANDTGVKSQNIKIEHFRDYLPLGFKADGKIFKDFDVAIKQKTDTDSKRKALTAILVAKTSQDGSVSDTFTKIRSARIASMIGTNGGYIDGDKATGVQGVWEINKDQLPGSADSGTIVATSIEAVADGTSGGSDVLHRVHVDGHPEYNVMATALDMGNHDIVGLKDLISHGDTINMKKQGAVHGLTLDVDGQGLYRTALYAGDNAIAAAPFKATASYLQHTKDLYIGTSRDNSAALGSANKARFYVSGETGAVQALKGNFEAGLFNSTPFVQLTGSNSATVMNANETMVSFMDTQFKIDPFANTTIDGTVKADKTAYSNSKSNWKPYNLNVENAQTTLEGAFSAGKKSSYSGPSYWNDYNFNLYGANASFESGIDFQKTQYGGDIGYNLRSYEYSNYGKVIQAGYDPTHADKYNTLMGKDLFYTGKYSSNPASIANKVVFEVNNRAAKGFVKATIQGKGNLSIGDTNTEINDLQFYVNKTTSTGKTYDNTYDANRLFDVDKTTSGYVTAPSFHAGSFADDGTKTGFYTQSPNNYDDMHFRLKKNNSDIYYLTSKNTNLINMRDNYIKMYGERGSGTGAYQQETFTIEKDIGKSFPTVSVKESAFRVLGKTIKPGGAGWEDENVFTVAMSDDNVTAGHGMVNVRRGWIGVVRNDDTVNPKGYIKADRLVSNVEGEIDGKYADAYYNRGYGVGYDEYQVNPAYTSMMHDIKLATRGGARLSDILPDFINKGIYVMDNTYKVVSGDGDWTSKSVEYRVPAGESKEQFILEGLNPCTKTHCDTSPWLGFIPTPNCPPGYMKVATIAPIRFNMAQTGIPMQIDKTKNDIDGVVANDEYRVLGARHDPRGDNVEVNNKRTGNTLALVPLTLDKMEAQSVTWTDSDGNNNKDHPEIAHVATMLNSPYTFQVSTWLNTTIKAYRKDTVFKGWHGIMGFIYPAKDYEAYARAINTTLPAAGPTDVYWNLFPVYKEELSAIATVYCYFKRTSTDYDTNFVDPYLAHQAKGIDFIRNTSKTDTKDNNSTYLNRLNDETLGYTTYW